VGREEVGGEQRADGGLRTAGGRLHDVWRIVVKLPYSIRVLLESMLRNLDGFVVTADDVSGLANWNAKAPVKEEIPFMPGRVVLQDFTGVPCVVDLAAMRDAMKKLGGDPNADQPAGALRPGDRPQRCRSTPSAATVAHDQRAARSLSATTSATSSSSGGSSR
jgi:hypothetical protein